MRAKKYWNLVSVAGLLVVVFTALMLTDCGDMVCDGVLGNSATTFWSEKSCTNYLNNALDLYPGCVNTTNKHGATPLHMSAGTGRKKIAELLIARGAGVNAQTIEKKKTPLCWAAYNGHKDVAELLIAKGADIKHKDKWDGFCRNPAADIAKSAHLKEFHVFSLS